MFEEQSSRRIPVDNLFPDAVGSWVFKDGLAHSEGFFYMYFQNLKVKGDSLAFSADVYDSIGPSLSIGRIEKQKVTFSKSYLNTSRTDEPIWQYNGKRVGNHYEGNFRIRESTQILNDRFVLVVSKKVLAKLVNIPSPAYSISDSELSFLNL